MTIDKLKRLQELCKASITIEINLHKDYHQSAESYLEEQLGDEIDPDVYEKMVELDTIVEIQFYPRTPISFYIVYHYDLEIAIDECLEIAEKEK